MNLDIIDKLVGAMEREDLDAIGCRAASLPSRVLRQVVKLMPHERPPQV
jgi:hypothetical protein